MMRVPSSPHSLKKAMSVPKSMDGSSSSGEDDGPLKSVSSNYNRKTSWQEKKTFKIGCYEDDDEEFEEVPATKEIFGVDPQATDGVCGSDFSTSESSPQPPPSLSRGRDRTRRSAVLRLLERKQAEKEKEKERDLKRSLRRSRARSEEAAYAAAAFTTASSSSPLFTDSSSSRARSRSTSEENFANSAKTYISIGPGKPTRIREHSPVKREFTFSTSSSTSSSSSLAGSSTSSATSSSGLKSNRLRDSPSPSTLRSAELLRDIPIKKSPSTPAFDGRKRSFTTEKTLIINGHHSNHSNGANFAAQDVVFNRRRRSMDVSTSSSSKNSTPRSSAERECQPSSRSSSFSSTTSSLSNASSDSLSSASSSAKEELLSKRRISLEERFRARATRLPSPERQQQQRQRKFSSTSSKLLYNLSSGYRYHRASAAASSASSSPTERTVPIYSAGRPPAAPAPPPAPQRNRRYSHDHSRSSQPQHRPPPSRKISLPPTCHEDPEHKRWDKNHNMGFTDTNNGDGIDDDNNNNNNTLNKLISGDSSSLKTPFSSLPLSSSQHVRLKSHDSGLGVEAIESCSQCPEDYSRESPVMDEKETKAMTSVDSSRSASAVSGTGMDFFRKFVQRNRGPNSCRECEMRFRRDVLIDRLVSDSLSSDKNREANNGIVSKASDQQQCTHHRRQQQQQQQQQICNSSVQSLSTRSSLTLSTVSGSGVRFLRNYLRKKTKAPPPPPCDYFNCIPVPFPPVNEFYGPGHVVQHRQFRLSSMSREIDSEADESDELKNLDWTEWEELPDSEPFPAADLLIDDDDLSLLECLRTAEVSFEEEDDDDDDEEEGRKTLVQSEIDGDEEEEVEEGSVNGREEFGQNISLLSRFGGKAAEEEEEEDNSKFAAAAKCLSSMLSRYVVSDVAQPEGEEEALQTSTGIAWSRIAGLNSSSPSSSTSCLSSSGVDDDKCAPASSPSSSVSDERETVKRKSSISSQSTLNTLTTLTTLSRSSSSAAFVPFGRGHHHSLGGIDDPSAEEAEEEDQGPSNRHYLRSISDGADFRPRPSYGPEERSMASGTIAKFLLGKIGQNREDSVQKSSSFATNEGDLTDHWQRVENLVQERRQKLSRRKERSDEKAV